MRDGADAFSLQFIRESTGGSWLSAVPTEEAICVRTIGTDTRSDLRGAAFVALRGGRHDGHDHVAEAVRAGAEMLIVDRASIREEAVRRAAPEQGAAAAIPTLVVDDTLAALQRLAAAHRRRLVRTTVIAVTGSAGKTTTRRLIHAALSTTLVGTQSPRSFNNAVGVPLTLLGASPSDRFLVAEVGMNAPGEIEALGRLIEPDIVVITSIGRAHLEGLGSVEAIAAEKASLLRCRRPGGVAVVRDGIDVLEPHLTGIEPLIRFGTDAGSTLRLLERRPTDLGQELIVEGPLRIALPLPGEHNAVNALAAVAVARFLGVPDTEIAAGLALVSGEAMRLERIEIELADGPPATVINDAYNANPESMIAALTAFAEVAAGATRRLVVLGRMLELGDAAPRLHGEVVDALVELDRLAPTALAILVGGEWTPAAAELSRRWGSERVRCFVDADDRSMEMIAAQIRPGDMVLLKGSRGVALERIVGMIPRRRAVVRAEGKR